jgi:hypothetical protein
MDLKRHLIRMPNPKNAPRHDLDALIQEAQKDEMIVLVEFFLPETYTDNFGEILDTMEIKIKEEEILETTGIEIKEEFVADLLYQS